MSEYRNIIILGGITVGIPILLLILMFSANSSMSPGLLLRMLGSLVVGLFLVGALFEIKRMVDQKDHHGDHH